jgi:phosphohistidine phosphatase SixA
VILLLRHASAGDSAAWEGDDHERPLDKRGRKQAKALVEQLGSFEPVVIVSSPYLRCLQTVEPLARSLGVTVDVRGELGYERHDQETRALVESLAGLTAVVCGHGGLESVVLGAGLGDGVPKWRKGATFVLDDELRLVESLRAD